MLNIFFLSKWKHLWVNSELNILHFSRKEFRKRDTLSVHSNNFNLKLFDSMEHIFHCFFSRVIEKWSFRIKKIFRCWKMIQNKNWKFKKEINIRSQGIITKMFFFVRCKECDCMIAWVVHCCGSVIYNYVITIVRLRDSFAKRKFEPLKSSKKIPSRHSKRHVESEKFELCQNWIPLWLHRQIKSRQRQTHRQNKNCETTFIFRIIVNWSFKFCFLLLFFSLSSF